MGCPIAGRIGTMSAPEFPDTTPDAAIQRETPPLALLLDVDGPIASPVSRRVSPGIIADLLALATAGIPVIFNTGRSDEFIRTQVMEPMIAAGMPRGTVVHAICEKGAVWFSYTADGPNEVAVDDTLAVPAAYGDAVRSLVAESFSAQMFFDETKAAMVSVEQHIGVDNADYLAVQPDFDARAFELMGEHGLGAIHLDSRAPDADGAVSFRIDPTIISTDIESVLLGKDLGASRAVELLAAQGITPTAWRTVGDSRTDYAMAEWLNQRGHVVEHVDVRPADGIPSTKYRVRTAADLGLGAEVIHDDAGAAFLRSWRQALGI